MKFFSLSTSNGKVLVPTGRGGGFVDIESTTVDKLLSEFDEYVAWVKEDPKRLHRRRRGEISPKVRQIIIDGFAEGSERLRALKGGAS